MKENLGAPVGTGILAILTILLVLVLSIFSALALSTAQADLALAQRGADTVTAYYEADGVARGLLSAFREGDDETFETIVPIHELQGLYVQLSRRSNGEVAVLAWRTVLMEEFSGYAERALPIWTGED